MDSWPQLQWCPFYCGRWIVFHPTPITITRMRTPKELEILLWVKASGLH